MKSLFKYSFSEVQGRGAGLGNEMIPWARSYVIGTKLGANVLLPAFGLNKRKYSQHFGTSKTDWISRRLLTFSLPKIEFSEDDFNRSTKKCLFDAVEIFSDRNKLKNKKYWIVTTKGMWGGYAHVKEAKEYIRSQLYLSKYALNNIWKIKEKIETSKLLVGIHIRLGDFSSAVADGAYRGRFNISLPMQWYVNIIKSICIKTNNNVVFLMVTDGTEAQLKPLTSICSAMTTVGIKNSDISDMLALSEVDLLICSVSSYSAWAAFLSSAPYVWFEPNLQKINGYYSIWGHEESQKNNNSYTLNSVDNVNRANAGEFFRGHPVGMSGDVPNSLIEYALNRKNKINIFSDLINYGVVPVGPTD